MKALDKDGWYFVRSKGDHNQYNHDVKKGTVTLAYKKESEDIPEFILKSILKQSGLSKDDLTSLIDK